MECQAHSKMNRMHNTIRRPVPVFYRWAIVMVSLGLFVSVYHLKAESHGVSLSPSVLRGAWLGRQLMVWEDTGAQADITAALAAARAGKFRALKTDVPRLPTLSASAYWLQLQLHNPQTQSQRIYLELRNATINEVDLYIPDEASNIYRREISGDARPFALRNLPHRTPAFRLHIKPGTHTFYLRVGGYSFKKIPLRVYSVTEFEKSAATSTVLHGLFYGASLVMTLFNLLLFWTIRDRTYAYLALFILFWAVTMFDGDGYSAQFFWPQSTPALQIFHVFNPLSAIAFLLFLRRFLRSRRHTPRLDQFVLRPLIAAFALYALSYPLQSDLFRLYVGFGFILPSGFFVAVIAFALGWYVWRRGNPAGFYHTIAGLVFMLVGELNYLEVFELAPSNALTENGARIGFLVYIALLTVGAGQRIKKIKDSLQNLNARLDLESLRHKTSAAPASDPTTGEPTETTPENENGNTSEWTITPRTEALLQKTIERIHRDFREDLSRESLAEEFGWNPDNLGRFFKMYTGERIGDTIHRLRVEAAARILRDTEDRVIDVAFAVGFDSLKTFNRNFARLMHTTPSEFRKISQMARDDQSRHDS